MASSCVVHLGSNRYPGTYLQYSQRVTWAELQLRAAATFDSTPPTPSATRKPTHLPVNPHPTITMSAAWKTAGLSYASLRCNWGPGHRN
jgi:hypothetical protein